jgi:hypothetical protein
MPTKSKLDTLRASAQQRAYDQACMPQQQKPLSPQESIRQCREYADKLEQQEKDRKREAKRQRKHEKRVLRRQADARAQLVRISKGSGKAAVMAAQALMHDSGPHGDGDMPF